MEVNPVISLGIFLASLILVSLTYFSYLRFFSLYSGDEVDRVSSLLTASPLSKSVESPEALSVYSSSVSGSFGSTRNHSEKSLNTGV